MATTETEVVNETEAPPSAPASVATPPKSNSILEKLLDLLSSVKFGLVMLGTLLTCCMIGMLIIQVNVKGFDEYYANLKPAERQVYGALNFFDIYRSRYFTLLLAITGLNIILASIDRFPKAWKYVSEPRRSVSPKFISAQNFIDSAESHADAKKTAEGIRDAWRRHGFKGSIVEQKGRFTVFAQRNPWNRLGAYFVHVALLTIFVGGFLTSRYSVGGNMQLLPGKTANTFIREEITTEGSRSAQVTLPFQVECLDIQQKLIRNEGGLDAQNTIDWLSYIRIKDSGKQKDLLVHLNNVGDYRGYRFFQSEFVPVGNARQVILSFEPQSGGGQPIGPVTIMRNSGVDVPGIGTVRYIDFFPDFQVTEKGPTTISRDYNNPAAQLEITTPDGKRHIAFAFNPKLADEYLNKANAKVDKEGGENPLLVNGNKVILRDFEKSSSSHTLTIQYDPGRTPVYIGFLLLPLSLCSVFFFAHQRVWAVVVPEERGSRVHFGGHTNRNRPAFEARFNLLVASAIGGSK
ncbi:MAG TPA: cytochrome c biogenesis protein ResB [Blastocatellia bacterium]|nr:cytochrome c biogenesis protein ResB [Blastocatellia bacterium]